MVARIVLLLGLTLGFAPLHAQNGWTAKEKQDFQKGCTKDIGKIFSKLDGKHVQEFCSCYGNQLEKSYPNIEDMNKASKNNTEAHNEIIGKARECWLDVATKYPKVADVLAEYLPEYGDRIVKDTTLELEYSPKMKKLFIQQCVSEGAKGKEAEAFNVPQYCSCMWDKIQVRYPNYRDFLALQVNGTVDYVEHFSDEINECVRTNLNKFVAYTPEIEKEFITTCADGLKGNKEINGKKYCRCMYEKMQIKYPNYADIIKISQADEEEDAFGKAFEKEIEECLDQAKK